MKIADISVKRPVGVIIMVMIVMILGAVSLTDLSIDLLPDLELPVAVVLTDYSGAAPQEVENLVTSPLEGTMSTLEGLDTMQSISAPNQSIVFMRFDFGTDIDNTLLDIRDRVDLSREALPDGSGDPLILKFDPNSFPIMQISLSGEKDIIQLTEWAEEVIQPRLERLSGVGQVSLTGREARAVEVEVDPAQLELYGIHITDIVQLIGSENVSGSAGTLNRGSQNMSLRVVGEFESADEIADINIPVSSGDTVKLSELADVEERLQTPSSFSYVNGERTLSMDITKQSDANTVDVANAVHAELERIQNSMPERMQLDTVWDSSRFIRESISNVVTTMLIGAVMAVIVLLLFLRSFRSMFVVAASIPIAIISAFTLIYFSGQTLNILTMGGLALGVGLMVDSSIVILENIAKYRERGYPRIEAAKKGAAEIGGAVIAATLTSIVVFLPIVFTGGIAAEIFMPLALTVTFTLVASLLVALTLVPMLSSKMLPSPLSVEEQLSLWQRIGQAFGKVLDGLNDVYKSVLQWSIEHKKTIFFGTLLLLIGSLFLIPLVGVEFLPMFDQGEILVEVDMPPGTDIEKTEEVLYKIESFLLDYPGMDLVFTSIGGDASRMSMRESSDQGSIYARLLPRAERNITTQQVIDDTTEFSLNIPDADIQVTAMQSAELGEEQVSIEISGNDLNILQSIAVEVEETISPVPGVANITNSMD
jgi:hydrophobic/amphiphilic exporter-1 (mainly G- bacteria), HAE1 family